ncbi:ComF family protein [Minwuia thermotolerans]|uniref:Amidophosphoribosyltransferase n=1 Tax=Minwuia thermotolerans TaxID=2056226 RepID=A0A2M9G6N4_9PROT|nr:ComF family protein [Minwuia thermotolerans]PJK31363.1 amidophosphoribosyltransferase [Minwuia thermotolerans]
MKLLRPAARLALDVLLPPQCFACGAEVADPARLCARCFGESDFITEPMCACCGLPFDFETEPGRVCALCAAQPPVFDRARSAVRYDEPLRQAVLGFKHGDRTDMAAGLATLLWRAGRPLLADADGVVPVPLHRRRLWRRRYNQAALLSRELAIRAGIGFLPDLLERRRPTRSQGGLSATARRRNVRGAFRLAEGAAERVRDARLVLVDDVYTTGATVEACARVLRRGGAASVDVLTVARVVRAGQTH